METFDIKKDVEILLIEDDPAQAVQMVKTIEDHQGSKSILWLEDGIQAMNYLLGEGIFAGRNMQKTPKMIFLDVKIPRIDGLEVLYEIRKTPRLKHIPVIMMCSSVNELDRIGTYDPNVDNYLLKPLDSIGLTNILNGINRASNL